MPKFFELYVKENPITKVVECIDVIDEPNVYSKYLKNCTEDSISNITIPDFGKDHLLLKLAINGLIFKGKIDVTKNDKYYRAYFIKKNVSLKKGSYFGTRYLPTNYTVK